MEKEVTGLRKESLKIYARNRPGGSLDYLSRYYILLALVILGSLMFVGTTLRPVHAAGTGDLMSNVPVVDENTLNNAACGVAAATMILDYYSGRTIDITAVARFVQENSLGTNTDQLQSGLEAASTAPALGIGVPLTASWHTTDNTHWFSVLQAELDARRPIVLFLADGGTLGWNWHYSHFITVSGYTNDNSIIYHDPWDGKSHTLTNAAFEGAWGTTWNGNPPWWYMQITPSQPPTPIPPPTIPPTSVPSSPTSTVPPGGMWTDPSPTDGQTVSDVIHFAAHAYPTHPSDPAIAYVNFTVGSQGTWKVACKVVPPVTGDVFACDVNLKDLGIPYGQIQVSFDVYDQAGNVNNAPNGVHTLTYASLTGVTPVPPPALSVSPSSRVNNFNGCSTETHGGSGYLISCPFVLSNSTQTTSNLNWSVSASDPRVVFDQSSGTLAPGQSVTINAGMYGNGNGSLACPFAMTLVFKGSFNTSQVPLMCTEIGTNPDAYSFDNTYCSHNGNWVCVIKVGADALNTLNTPWAATVQTPDPNVTFSPAQGTLAPGATVQVTVTILNSACPSNNTFFFYVPGSLPIGGNYLDWSC
jgi:Peptidase_C39 like family